VSGTFTIPLRELTRLSLQTDRNQLNQVWRHHLTQNLTVATGQDCQLLESEVLPAAGGYARSRLAWRCPLPVDTLRVGMDIMFDRVASHVHFARFLPASGPAREQLFSQSLRHQTVVLAGEPLAGPTQNSGAVLTTYIRFGFEHILIGLDHVAFLASLLLLPTGLRNLLWIITGFTLGHSITLSLSALGLVTPDNTLVEALIGLSIALVAIENVVCHTGNNRLAAHLVAAFLVLLLAVDLTGPGSLPPISMLGLALFSWCYLQLADSPRRARRIRPTITALFGLVHGFGFASVLLEVGLPGSARIPALLGFNIGVELGQVTIVLALGACTWLCRGIWRHNRVLAVDTLSARLCALGVYWFLQRLWF
jgi:hypothetical protein